MQITTLALSALLACTLATSVTQAAPQPERLYPPQALQADLRFMQAEIARIHPAPGLFVSEEALRKAFEQVEGQLQQPLDRDQAWRVFAALNPVFADAHMFILYPDWKDLARAHLQQGGRFFPYEVQVDADGAIRIRTELGGKESALAGMRIDAINGVPAARVARALLALTAGETPALRTHILSRRMWFEYWKVFGAPAAFDLVVARPDGPAHFRVPGSTTAPASVETDDAARFRQTYRFELLPDKAALLTIDQFQGADQQAFASFTRDAFTQMRGAGVATLIIDVRANPGGDDAMWKAGVLPYIADKPFRNGSSYIKKVIAGRASGTEKVGDVVHGFGDTWVAPEPDHPLRFSGKTYVLVGRMTYSSAVLFTNVVQDFGFAQLVGAGGYARTRQTGGVQNVMLPNTGLEITIPRFVLDRPSGAREPALVHPDIVVPDSSFDRMQAVNALLDRIRSDVTAPSATVGKAPP
jgi:hypothetical protein